MSLRGPPKARRSKTLLDDHKLPRVKSKFSEMEEKKVPEGGVLRDDGCVCPAPPPPKVCGGKPPTCPVDPRFPNCNQTKHCYSSFVDYQRCARLLGDYPGCKLFYICYTALCPTFWTERWFEQMEKGIFPKKIYPPGPIIRPDPEKMRTICLEEEGFPQEIC